MNDDKLVAEIGDVVSAATSRDQWPSPYRASISADGIRSAPGIIESRSIMKALGDMRAAAERRRRAVSWILAARSIST